jgi:peptidoglycan LD-endopeptidase LytH
MKYLAPKRILIGLLIIVALGFLIPQRFTNPVAGADDGDYHPESFWFYPWGTSVVHKGVDIFAAQGTDVVAATDGVVVHTGKFAKGGNVVLVLGPKWRMHYYAHLKEINTGSFSWISKGEKLGAVGTTGNAAGKPPHLHYTIYSLVPYPWRIDTSRQGWKKMFFLNPISYLKEK